jgi:hypothetical protein
MPHKRPSSPLEPNSELPELTSSSSSLPANSSSTSLQPTLPASVAAFSDPKLLATTTKPSTTPPTISNGLEFEVKAMQLARSQAQENLNASLEV